MKRLINKIAENNGTALLVGGAVIDAIQNKEIKDWDIEVYNITYEKLLNILKELNLCANLVGKNFGIIKTKIDDMDIDLSIPRLENKIGIGHKGFEITLNPNLTPKEAGKRRDLTINSMYKNLHTGAIIDPFNGMSDLKNGIIKATDSKTFVDDPLRVLRIMQLLPRKGKIVSIETIELCKSIVNEFYSLPKERIFEEFKKLLLKSDKPSTGLNFLKDSGWLIHFPELFNLINTKQNPDWHPEGSVWKHTLLVVDNAAQIKDNIPEKLQLSFMFAALLHDVGKPSTTLEDLTSNGHDVVGIELSEKFMQRITNEIKLIENVKALVGLHMRVGQLAISKAKNSAWKRLHNKFRLDVLGWLSKCDSNGRANRNIENEHIPSELCFEHFKSFGVEKIKPLINGNDLILLGWKRGIELGNTLKLAFELQLDGMSKEEILKKILSN